MAVTFCAGVCCPVIALTSGRSLWVLGVPIPRALDLQQSILSPYLPNARTPSPLPAKAVATVLGDMASQLPPSAPPPI